MPDFFTAISDMEDIRQGDIIRKINPETGKTEKLGVVITADCDIAKSKAGDRYTWLEIISMKEYIEGPWAQEQLRRLAKKRSGTICDYLNSQIRKLQPDLSPLTQESLAEWLGKKTAEEIFEKATGQAATAENKQLRDLKGFALTMSTDESQSVFCRLQTAWTLFGIDEKSQQNNVRNALKESDGFQDYFVLPELPRQPGFGFVVMLRSMWPIMAPDLFLSEQDARIHDRPDAFHRLGRLNDGIRFSITQKLAFLFSRIGMPTSFESACEAAAEITSEEILKKSSQELP